MPNLLVRFPLQRGQNESEYAVWIEVGGAGRRLPFDLAPFERSRDVRTGGRAVKAADTVRIVARTPRGSAVASLG
jgi:hypothetical protein